MVKRSDNDDDDWFLKIYCMYLYLILSEVKRLYDLSLQKAFTCKLSHAARVLNVSDFQMFRQNN